MGRCSVLVANKTNPGRESQRKLGWLLLPREEGWQMCSKELSERKMHGIEKMKPTQKQGKFLPCVLSSICADSRVPGRDGLASKNASLMVKASNWISCMWFAVIHSEMASFMSPLGFAGALGCRYPSGTGIHVQLPERPFEGDRRALFLPGRSKTP